MRARARVCVCVCVCVCVRACYRCSCRCGSCVPYYTCWAPWLTLHAPVTTRPWLWLPSSCQGLPHTVALVTGSAAASGLSSMGWIQTPPPRPRPPAPAPASALPPRITTVSSRPRTSSRFHEGHRCHLTHRAHPTTLYPHPTWSNTQGTPGDPLPTPSVV